MAAPADATCTNLSGTFVLNKNLSDPVDPLLALQGISWLVRSAIGFATVVLTIKSYTDESGFHIDITSVASGLASTQENRTLDWEERPHEDRIFGKVNGKSRMWKTGEYQMYGQGTEKDAVFLRAETLKDGKTESKFLDDEHVQSVAISVDAGWIAEQNWGFEEINGERRYTRRVMVWKGGESQSSRFVYDYRGPVKSD